MPDRIFRLVSAGSLLVVVRAVIRVVTGGRDFAPDLDDLWAMAAGLVLAPTFAVHGLKGEEAAMKALLPGLALLHLPQILAEKLAARAELPAELEAIGEPADAPEEATPEEIEPGRGAPEVARSDSPRAEPDEAETDPRP